MPAVDGNISAMVMSIRWSPAEALETVPFNATAKNGSPIIVRLLDSGDGQALDTFLKNGLSSDSKKRFGAHQPDVISSDVVCKSIGTDGTIRIVSTSADDIVGYLILAEIPIDEAERYRSHGHSEFVSGFSVRLAPAVADSCQGQGVGRHLMRWATSLSSQLGIEKISYQLRP